METTLNTTAPEPVALTIDCGKGLALPLTEKDIATLLRHKNVRDHILIKLGTTTLVDCHASIVAKDFKTEIEWRNAAKAVLENKFAAMLRGEITTKGHGPRASKADPIAAEALRLARVTIGKIASDDIKFAALAKAAKMPFASSDERKALIAECVRRESIKPSIIELARQNVEGVKTIASDGLDLFPSEEVDRG